MSENEDDRSVVELIPSRKTFILRVNGHLYYRHSENKSITKWTCRNRKTCYAWVKTVSSGRNVRIVAGGPEKSKHKEAPDLEKVRALKVIAKVKRHAIERPEAPPAQLIRDDLSDVGSEVLSQLPDRQNLRKMITRERLKDLPTNPTSLKDLADIPVQYTVTANGKIF